jgi:ADP-ribose pyrophosphatase YjhB (NUDIX family)
MQIKAAGCLVTKTDEEGNTLFLAIKRKDSEHPDGWDLPCGKVIHNELLYEAAIRELQEETSLTVPTFASKGYYVGYNTFDAIFVIFELIPSYLTRGEIKSSPEGEVDWVPMSNILRGKYNKFNRAMLAYFGYGVPSTDY